MTLKMTENTNNVTWVQHVLTLHPDNSSYCTINLILEEKAFQKYLDDFSLFSSNRSFSLISST